VTTHYLEEAEHCNRMGFMVAGEVVTQGSPSQVKAEQPGSLLEVACSPTQAASDLLKTQYDPWRVSIFGDRLHVVLDHPDVEIPRCNQFSKQLKYTSTTFAPFRSPSKMPLSELFLGRKMRRILAQCSKELAQFRRDRLTLSLAFVLPIATLLLFSFGTRLESKNIPLVVQDFDQTPLSRAYSERFCHHPVRLHPLGWH
jgi:hypothetical protein